MLQTLTQINTTYYQLLESSRSKVLHIMRGLPGSGKSTLAKKVGEGGPILSTDEYFIKNDKYEYDPTKIGDAHMWNQDRARQHMERGTSKITIDNTNVQHSEYQPYVELARKHGYEVQFHKPSTSWAWDAEELAKRNTHGVPLEVIKGMLGRFEH